jgi:hypothetical protein
MRLSHWSDLVVLETGVLKLLTKALPKNRKEIDGSVRRWSWLAAAS